MRFLVSLVAAVTLAACSGAGGYTPPTAPQTVTEAAAPATSAKVVYVADYGANKLLVYPYGKQNPAPINSLSYAKGPTAVAVDSTGKVYVIHDTTVLSVLAPGTLREITTIAVDNPDGISIDSHDNLWVAEGGQINEYQAGSMSLRNSYALSGGVSPAGGVAVTSSGAVFASVLVPGQDGAAFAEITPQYREVWNMGGPGGVVAMPDGRLISGSAGSEFVYSSQPPYRPIDFHDVRKYGYGIAYLTANDHGDLAVPFTRTASVAVFPGHGTSVPFLITQGLNEPTGAAVSP